MNGEDRNSVMDQITSYDRFASAVTVAGSLNRAFAVVAVPPKALNTQEKWVAQLVLWKDSLIPVFGSLIQRERPFVLIMSTACVTGMLTSFHTVSHSL